MATNWFGDVEYSSNERESMSRGNLHSAKYGVITDKSACESAYIRGTHTKDGIPVNETASQMYRRLKTEAKNRPSTIGSFVKGVVAGYGAAQAAKMSARKEAEQNMSQTDTTFDDDYQESIITPQTSSAGHRLPNLSTIETKALQQVNERSIDY